MPLSTSGHYWGLHIWVKFWLKKVINVKNGECGGKFGEIYVFLAPNTMQKPDCERVERVEMRPGEAAVEFFERRLSARVLKYGNFANFS